MVLTQPASDTRVAPSAPDAIVWTRRDVLPAEARLIRNPEVDRRVGMQGRRHAATHPCAEPPKEIPGSRVPAGGDGNGGSRGLNRSASLMMKRSRGCGLASISTMPVAPIRADRAREGEGHGSDRPVVGSCVLDIVPLATARPDDGHGVGSGVHERCIAGERAAGALPDRRDRWQKVNPAGEAGFGEGEGIGLCASGRREGARRSCCYLRHAARIGFIRFVRPRRMTELGRNLVSWQLALAGSRGRIALTDGPPRRESAPWSGEGAPGRVSRDVPPAR